MTRFFERLPHEYCAPAKRHLYRGQMLTALDISQLSGIPRSTIYARLRRGDPLDQPSKPGPKPKRYLFRGEMMTVRQVARLTGLDKSTLYDRISGDRMLEAEEIPSAYQCLEDFGKRIKVITYRGKSNSIAGWASELNMSIATLHSRLCLGWNMERIVNTPVDHRRANPVLRHNRRLIRHITTAFRAGVEVMG